VDEDFLWVSDGRAVWGREAVLARMGRFQQAEVWNVTPDLANARVVVLSEDAALMNLTLTLEIGKAEQPSKLGFVVTIAFQKVDDVWRIAALLTTADKS
jgi:SnoaL-like protein